MPPHITKRTITNLKTKTNQNCQKIKLYRSPTTKEIKKTHSSRPVRRVERNKGKAAAGGPGQVRWRMAASRPSGPTFACG